MKRRFILTIMLHILLNQDQALAILRIVYDSVEPIPVGNDSKLHLTIHIAPYNNSLIEAEILLHQNLDSNRVKMVSEVQKCLVREAPDTCEYLINLKPVSSCFFLNAENAPWSTITGAFVPKLKCPIKKGKYVAKKIEFDGSKWTIFPLEKWNFILRFKLYEGNVLLGGLFTEHHYVRVN